MAETVKTISFDANRYNQLKELTVRGVKMQGSLTPYDVPREARVSYNGGAGRYTIHFVYLTPDEPKNVQNPSPDVALYFGQYSGKLYDIIIRRQDSRTLWNAKLQLIADISDLAEKSEGTTPPNHLKGLNLLVAKQFLEENQDLLFSFSE